MRVEEGTKQMKRKALFTILPPPPDIWWQRACVLRGPTLRCCECPCGMWQGHPLGTPDLRKHLRPVLVPPLWWESVLPYKPLICIQEMLSLVLSFWLKFWCVNTLQRWFLAFLYPSTLLIVKQLVWWTTELTKLSRRILLVQLQNPHSDTYSHSEGSLYTSMCTHTHPPHKFYILTVENPFDVTLNTDLEADPSPRPALLPTSIATNHDLHLHSYCRPLTDLSISTTAFWQLLPNTAVNIHLWKCIHHVQ